VSECIPYPVLFVFELILGIFRIQTNERDGRESGKERIFYFSSYNKNIYARILKLHCLCFVPSHAKNAFELLSLLLKCILNAKDWDKRLVCIQRCVWMYSIEHFIGFNHSQEIGNTTFLCIKHNDDIQERLGQVPRLSQWWVTLLLFNWFSGFIAVVKSQEEHAMNNSTTHTREYKFYLSSLASKYMYRFLN